MSPAEADAKHKAEAEQVVEPAPALPRKARSERTLAELIAGLLDQSPLPDRMAALDILASSVDEEPRRIFAVNILAELDNMSARKIEHDDPWQAVA